MIEFVDFICPNIYCRQNFCFVFINNFWKKYNFLNFRWIRPEDVSGDVDGVYEAQGLAVPKPSSAFSNKTFRKSGQRVMVSYLLMLFNLYFIFILNKHN